MHFTHTHLFLLIVTCLGLLRGSAADQGRFRFLLEPGTQTCFYEDTKMIGNFMEFSYKVERGGPSGLSFVIRDPANNIIVEDKVKLQVLKKRILAKSWGEYQFCFRHNLPYFPEKKIEFLYSSVEKPLMEPLTFKQKNPTAKEAGDDKNNYDDVISQLTRVELAVARSVSKLEGLWDRLNDDMVQATALSNSIRNANVGIASLVVAIGVFQVYLVRRAVGDREGPGTKEA